MKREEVRELHFIAHIDNVPSILNHGILSHNAVASMRHVSVAMREIQARRIDKQIPGAGSLHDYANLYFDAHNPMLSKVRRQNDEICVLRVIADVLDLPGVIIADRNAASDYVRFYQTQQGLCALDSQRVFATYWTHPCDKIEEYRHKSEKCAEVLVPKQVPPQYFLGAFVANTTALLRWQALDVSLSATICSGLFF